MKIKYGVFVCFIFTIVISLAFGFQKVALAIETLEQGQTIEALANDRMQEWINEELNWYKSIQVDRYKGSDNHYFAVSIGDQDALGKYGFIYDSPTRLSFTAVNPDTGLQETCYVNINANIHLYYKFYTHDEKGRKASQATEGTITLTANELSNNVNDIAMVIPGISLSTIKREVTLDYDTHKDHDGNAPMLEISGCNQLIPRNWLFDNGVSNVKIGYTVQGPNGIEYTGESEPLVTDEVVHNETVLDNVGNWLGEAFTSFFGGALDIIQRIINAVALLIADGAKALVNAAIHEDLTPGKIIYGETTQFSINFWNQELQRDSNSMVHKMHGVVNQWFNYFRGLGITVYLIILLYIGVKVLLSSTSKSIEDAKEKLTSWAMGVIILFLGPMVMRYAIDINDSLVSIIAKKGNEIQTTSEGEKKDMMEVVHDNAREEGLLIITVIYLIMIGQLIVLIINYYKRAFMLGFLITIFPIVATFYVWEKTQKGGARALENWTKEFIVLVFTQLVHAIVYAVLVEGMYDALVGDSGGNYILYILCVTFLFKAEGIVKQIFNVRSTAGTIGDMAASGAASFAVAKSVTSVFQRTEKGAAADDAKAEKEATDKVNTLNTNTRANSIRKQVESEGNTTPRDIGANKGNANASQGSEAGGDGANAGGTAQPSGQRPTVTPEAIKAKSENVDGKQSKIGLVAGANGMMGAPQNQRPDTTARNQKAVRASNEMSDLEKARLVQRQKALKAKNGGKIRKIAKFAVRNSARAAGIVAGLAIGAAQGDVGKAVQSAATLGIIGAKLGSGATKITDAAVGRFAGARLRLKSENGDFKEDLRRAGVSEEFIEQVYSDAKGKAIRDALAKEMSGVRRGGTALGDVKFTGTMERETRNTTN